MPLIRPKKRLFQIGFKQIKKFVPKGVKGALSSLRQFLATESPLKMMKMLFISP